MRDAARPPLLAIGGPTASGKTALAIELARALDGEIVNADSRQIYLGMECGTASPTAAQRAAVPHHLLDLVRPSDPFTLATYVDLAHRAIREIAARGRLPLLVGGTGLYLRAVTRGYRVPEVAPDPEWRRLLEREAAADGGAALVERLRAVDPQAAARIDPRNIRRLIRALEVSLHLGTPFSALQRQEPPYRSLTVILEGDRERLYARADARLAAMIAAGFEDEVARLLAAGYGPELPAFSALGYRELAASLRGELSREAAIERTRMGTHAFIRRQVTWFRGDRDARRLPVDAGDPLAGALDLVRAWDREAAPC